MSKCKICKSEAEYIWQPFGPADDAKLVVFPGWHYRGYVALAVCKEHADKINAGVPFSAIITHRKKNFEITFDGTHAKAVEIK